MSSQLTSIVTFTFLIILLCSSIHQANARLSSTDFVTLTYDELLRNVVKDQVEHHTPAQKSLHSRNTKRLDGVHDFCLDPKAQGFEAEWFAGELRQKCEPKNFYKIPVPAAFNDITSNTTVRNYVGWFWYQWKVNIETSTATKNYFIQFENVNYMAAVWIRDPAGRTKLLGSHVGGYLPFIFNITNAVYLHGWEDDYRLTVAVSNRLTKDTIPSGTLRNLSEIVGHDYEKFQPDFDFFHFAGILGSVHLIELNALHISQVDYLSSELQEDKSIRLLFRVCLSLRGLEEAGKVIVWLDSSLLGANFMVSDIQDQFSLSGGDCFNVTLHAPANADRWTLADGNPNHFSRLDIARFTLLTEDQSEVCHKNSSCIGSPFLKRHDRIELRVGLRGPIQLGKSSDANLLNGEQLRLRGFGMHHEQLFSGRTMSPAAIMKDMYLLKQVGANVIRTSHYPYSSEYLDACDENGILVIAECQAVGLNSFSDTKLMLHKQLLLEMMQRDNHHSSIIMWSIANEPQSQLQESEPYFRSLLSYARKELANYTTGAHRPLTAAIAQSHQDDRLGEMLDVIMVNRYYGWYDYTGVLAAIRPLLSASLAGWAQKHPHRPLVLSEFGADTIAGLHSTTGVIFSEEFQRNLLVEYERVLQDIANNSTRNGINLWGSMIWNFADFSTHETINRVGGNKKGIFTQNREPKLAVGDIQGFYLDSGLSTSPSARMSRQIPPDLKNLTVPQFVPKVTDELLAKMLATR